MRHWTVLVLLGIAGCASAPKEEAAETPTETSTEDPSKLEDTPGTEEKLGSLPKEEIRSVVRENMRNIQRCYDTQLASDSSLEGKVVMHFKISKEGTIDSVSVAESELNNRAVESCMMQEIRTWEFMEPENDGVVIVNYPFNFKAP